MASITLNHIVKTFDDGVTVIPDLNLEIKDKEFWTPSTLMEKTMCREN